MARSTIEISGHIIIDSRILPKVLDIIINLGGVLDSSIKVGHRRADRSYALVQD
jgi:hypothetical protein